MNAWKINSLMNQHFPQYDFSKLSFVNVEGKPAVLASFLKSHIQSDDILVSMNRSVGARLSLSEAVEFIQVHIGTHNIRISNRAFTQFVMVTINCTVVAI